MYGSLARQAEIAKIKDVTTAEDACKPKLRPRTDVQSQEKHIIGGSHAYFRFGLSASGTNNFV